MSTVQFQFRNNDLETQLCKLLTRKIISAKHHHLFEPYLWYVRTKTRVKIMWDENIKSPQPKSTPRGTAKGNSKFWTKRKINYSRNLQTQQNKILTVNQKDFKYTIGWWKGCQFRALQRKQYIASYTSEMHIFTCIFQNTALWTEKVTSRQW
jgi:hypothetical protein